MNNTAIHELNRTGGGLVLLVGLVVVMSVSCVGGYTLGEDAAIERLQGRQAAVAQREKALKVDTSAAFSDGWTEGRASIGCIGGFRIDARTGKPLQLAEGR